MDFYLLGFSHKTAPVEVRETLDFSKSPAEAYLPGLCALAGVTGGAVVSTCNRVEIYVTTEAGADPGPALKGWLAARLPAGAPPLDANLYVKRGTDALAHLLRVACSLDSMVVGEPQILGQVKDAYQDARRLGFAAPLLDRVFQRVFAVAKRARSETKIGAQAVSISYLAVELARKIHGDLAKTSVLVLGAGEMAELCARHLKAHHPKAIAFANRTYENSLALAQEYHGAPIEFGEFKAALPEMDIVIVSTGASHHLIGKDDVAAALAARRQRPMFLIDISVPRNVDPATDALENAYLYDIDDLQQLIDQNQAQRREAAAEAEAIVVEETARFTVALERLRLTPLIQAMRVKYAAMLEKEFERLEKRLPADGKEELRRAREAILKKVLHHPLDYANRRLVDADLERAAQFMEILGLKKEADDD